MDVQDTKFSVGAPGVTKAEIVGNTKIAITFTEALDTSSVPAPANFYVTVNGAGRAVTDVKVAGQTVTLTLQGSVAAGQVVSKFSYSSGANPIRDLTSTSAADISNRDVTNTPDTTPPIQISGVVSSNMITLSYNEELAAVSPFAYTQFSVTVAGSYRTITQVTGTANVLYITFSGNPVSNTDLVALSYYPSSYPIKDIAGNSAASFTSFNVQNGLDTKAPILQSATVTGSLVKLVYDEALNSAMVPSASAFSVLVGGKARGIASINISGPQVTLTLASAVTSADIVVLSYTAGTPAIADPAGNAAASIGSRQLSSGGRRTILP